MDSVVVIFLFLLLAGLAGGYLAGLIGIGGGIIYVSVIPIALRLLGVPGVEIAQYTIANSIFAVFFASTAASIALVKMNNFYIRPVLLMAISSSIVSVFVLKFIVNTDWYDVVKFNMVLIALLIYMLIYTIRKAKKDHDNDVASLGLFHLLLVGACCGLVTAVSGLGGGIIVIPLLSAFYKIDIKKAGSVSLGVIMITPFLMTLFNILETPRVDFHFYSLGYVVFPVGLMLVIGVMISAPMGVKKASQIRQKTISYIYASVLAIVIIKKSIELYLVL